jgi:hypothetical protein
VVEGISDGKITGSYLLKGCPTEELLAAILRLVNLSERAEEQVGKGGKQPIEICVHCV